MIISANSGHLFKCLKWSASSDKRLFLDSLTWNDLNHSWSTRTTYIALCTVVSCSSLVIAKYMDIGSKNKPTHSTLPLSEKSTDIGSSSSSTALSSSSTSACSTSSKFVSSSFSSFSKSMYLQSTQCLDCSYRRRKVLIPVDERGSTRCAVDWYCSDVAQPGDHVILLFITSAPSGTSKDLQMHWITYDSRLDLQDIENPVCMLARKAVALKAQFEEQFRRCLETLCRDVQEQLNGWQVNLEENPPLKWSAFVRASSRPSTTIMKAVESMDVDFILMGSRRLSKTMKALWGSVSAEVVHHSPVPVIIVPSKFR